MDVARTMLILVFAGGLFFAIVAWVLQVKLEESERKLNQRNEQLDELWADRAEWDRLWTMQCERDRNG